jgi:DNA-binding PadR family transcriptional regulator
MISINIILSHIMSSLSRQRHYILLALSSKDLHGSGIARAVLDETEGELRLWPATLYGTLELMVRDGLIEELDEGERPRESEKRRYYRITPLGEKALARETERLARLVRTARQNLKRRGSEVS